MATHQIWIPAAGLTPDTSGNVFSEPYSIKATNDIFPFNVLIFNDTSTRLGAYGTFHVPQNYVGTPKIYPVWSSTAITGNVVWDVDYRAVGGDDAESMDQATAQEALTVTDAAPSAAHERNTPSVSLTAANLAAGDTVEFGVFRDGADAADTMAAAAILFGVLVEYADA